MAATQRTRCAHVAPARRCRLHSPHGCCCFGGAAIGGGAASTLRWRCYGRVASAARQSYLLRNSSVTNELRPSYGLMRGWFVVSGFVGLRPRRCDAREFLRPRFARSLLSALGCFLSLYIHFASATVLSYRSSLRSLSLPSSSSPPRSSSSLPPRRLQLCRFANRHFATPTATML